MQRQILSTPLECSPIHLLHRAGQRGGDIFLLEMGASDLTARQYAVLVTVGLMQGASQTKLVEATGIDRSTLADIVRRLIAKDLLDRRRTREDARVYSVRLTEKGQRLLDAAEPIMRRVDDKILAALPREHRMRFLEDLSTIVEALAIAEETAAVSMEC